MCISKHIHFTHGKTKQVCFDVFLTSVPAAHHMCALNCSAFSCMVLDPCLFSGAPVSTEQWETMWRSLEAVCQLRSAPMKMK